MSAGAAGHPPRRLAGRRLARGEGSGQGGDRQLGGAVAERAHRAGPFACHAAQGRERVRPGAGVRRPRRRRDPAPARVERRGAARRAGVGRAAAAGPRGVALSARRARRGRRAGGRACGRAGRGVARRGLEVHGAATLAEVLRGFRGARARRPGPPADAGRRRPPPDLADVVGQDDARHACEIAAAGGHHLLLVGPPGTGKTMLAQRFVGLLPSSTPRRVGARLDPVGRRAAPDPECSPPCRR